MSVQRDKLNLEGVLDAYEAELLAATDEDVLAEATEAELASARGVLETALAATRQQPAAARRRRPPSRTVSPPVASPARRRPEQMRATFSSDPNVGLDDDDPGGLPD